MNAYLSRLGPNAQRGSKPRCHFITEGTPKEVAGRLTELIKPWGYVETRDRWMPQGFDQIEEAQLHKADRLIGRANSDIIRDWWFKIVHGQQAGPNFDIASTCTVAVDDERRRGVLLVEAKAHVAELDPGGMHLPANPSPNELTNRDHIKDAIDAVNSHLTASTQVQWELSRDSHYQMSNRFAAACKLAELGYPVILVYLGFISANEMTGPFSSASEWEQLVKAHSAPLFPERVWNQPHTVSQQPFVLLICSTQIDHDKPIGKFVVF